MINDLLIERGVVALETIAEKLTEISDHLSGPLGGSIAEHTEDLVSMFGRVLREIYVPSGEPEQATVAISTE